MDSHIKRMNKLENHFEAIAHRGSLQEVGVVRPYTRSSEILLPILLGLRYRPYKPLMLKVTRTNIYTILIPNSESSTKRYHPGSFIHWHPQRSFLWMVHEASC